MFRKIKRVWSHNDMNYIPGFKEAFPELNKVSREEMCNRFSSLDMDFYTYKPSPVRKLVRLTMPFAIILIALMFIFMPINFIITGKWYYGKNPSNLISNWFRELGFTTLY